MMIVYALCVYAFAFSHVGGITLRKDASVVAQKPLQTKDDCDSSTIPVMASFDMKKFSGTWYELARTATGYMDVSDGVWSISPSNASYYDFLFTGRDNNQHCIRPIKGRMNVSTQPHGLLKLNYQTYATYVEENVRVLFTDYESVAVVYTCVHHVHGDSVACHAAGVVGSIWTRRPHVDVDVYEGAVKYLELACVHKTTLVIKNLVGPCNVGDLEFRIDDFPAPDFCYLPADLGSCRGSLQRYYYEPNDMACKPFLYGGCDGNRNNFMSLGECQNKCIVTGARSSVCGATAQCGIHCAPCCSEDSEGCISCNCEHVVVEDFLNCILSPSECPDKCELVHIYPGCNQCRCDRDLDVYSSPKCDEVMSTGNCNDNVERFYYQAETQQCRPFQYSGCGGNQNNFPTYQQCQEECLDTDNHKIVHGPMKVRTNNSVIRPRYDWTVLAIFLILYHIKCIYTF